MHPWNVTKSILKMFVLRAQPSELPRSPVLLGIFTTVFILLKSGIYVWFITIINRFDTKEVITLSYPGALIVAVIWILILFATLRTTLLFYNMVDKFIQTATAFVAMDCLLSLLFLVWLAGLSVVHLPLAEFSLGSIGIILGFVIMMYWQFMIYIHILFTSMNISVLKAGIFALFYMLLQHNLAEVLLNVVITVREI